MKKEINKPQWYIATTIIGSEESIYTSLIEKIKAYQFNDLVQEMRIVKYNDITIETFKDGSNPPPKTMRNSKNITWETTPDGRYIKKTTKTFNKFPGYLFIRMIMTEEVWYAIRNTPGITGFVGSSGKGAQPIPISEFELTELFDPDKNKDIIRHINASSVSIEEVDRIEEENPLSKKSDVEFFNSKATTSSILSNTRKIDFEKRKNKNLGNDDFISQEVIDSKSEDILEENLSINETINEKIIQDVESETKLDQKNNEIVNNGELNEFEVGNTVKIIDGSFKGCEALIIKLDTDNDAYICNIDFFGRNNEVKLRKNQIKK